MKEALLERAGSPKRYQNLAGLTLGTVFGSGIANAARHALARLGEMACDAIATLTTWLDALVAIGAYAHALAHLPR
jgi:hypothetical protein